MECQFGMYVIDLWTWSCSDEGSAPACANDLLSPEERERAARFVFGRDRTRFISHHSQMRRILSTYLSCDPRTIAFTTGPHGKPFLRRRHNSNLQFNLSHSEELAILAVAPGLELGIDVEMLRPLKEDVAGRFFSKNENEALAKFPAEYFIRGFFECWTSKEAFVKARGEGLSIPLDSFDVAIGPSVPPAILRIHNQPEAEAAAWHLWRFEPARGFVATLAARVGAHPWEIRRRTSG